MPKQQQSTTSKKNVWGNVANGANSQQMMGDLAHIDTPVPNLRLEAKLSAEENSRMLSGRKIHPFFSSLKVGNKFQEQAESEHSLCTINRKDERIACRFVQVFENTQCKIPPCKMIRHPRTGERNWKFLQETANANSGSESSVSSVLEGFLESLSFYKLPTTLNPSIASISQNVSSCSDQLCTQPQPQPQSL